MFISIFPDTQSVLLVVDGDGSAYRLPTEQELHQAGIPFSPDLWEYFVRDEDSFSGVFLDKEHSRQLTALLDQSPHYEGRDHFEIVHRRAAFGLLDMDDYWAMNRLFHLAHWDRNTRYCGACTAEMERSDGEISKRCVACGTMSYPHIAPAVIMAIVKDGKLLLAHNSRRPGNMYSVLAGFVEPGENLEHAVSREVHEESGILVRNIEYFGSQPWPFPGSLMIAFTAEYAGGTLTPDQDEIDDIGWFGPDELPAELPGTFSVARRLIEWFVSQHGSDDDLQRLVQRA